MRRMWLGREIVVVGLPPFQPSTVEVFLPHKFLINPEHSLSDRGKNDRKSVISRKYLSHGRYLEIAAACPLSNNLEQIFKVYLLTSIFQY